MKTFEVSYISTIGSGTLIQFLFKLPSSLGWVVIDDNNSFLDQLKSVDIR